MVDRDAVRRGYDELAETYAAERSDDTPGTDALSKFAASLPETARVLDAGCGQGTPVLSRLAASTIAVGVDFSRGQLELAAENAPDASLVQGDLTALPARDDAFDAITAYHSLIHVPLEEHGTVIEEFARILRPGGRVLLSEGPEEWCGANPDWLETGVEMQWNVAGADATREQLRDAGLAIDDEWGTNGTFAGDDERWVFFSATLERERPVAR